jgi:hypothetical protein
MSIIKEIIQRRKEKDRKVKEIEENDRIIRNLEEKKMSHYERELMRSLEEERQELIKEALKWDIRKRQAEDKIKAKQMMKFNSEMFNNDSILREKNVFLRGGDF